MSERNFMELLKARWAEGKFVCIGLDTEFGKIPECVSASSPSVFNKILTFNRMIVDATKGLVCAYKPNIAFYGAHGPEGLVALRSTIDHINRVAPEVPIILDAKRADIGNTNAGYVESAFDYLNADAITVHPYLGMEAMKPFLDRANKGIIVLCRTSNPGAGEFQDLEVQYLHVGNTTFEGTPLYEIIADRVASAWNHNGNCVVVVGATYPEELKRVRWIVGDLPILIPGIGAQGGDVEKTVKAGQDSRGRGMIINSSRGIIFASKGEDFAEAAHREAEKLHNLINQYRKETVGS